GTWLFNQLTLLLHVRWISFMMNSLLFISVFLIFRLLWERTTEVAPINRLSILLFFAGFFVESIVLYHMVRTTMFVGIAAVACVVFRSDTESSWFKWSDLPYIFLFAIAMWIRCNVHLFVLAFLSFGLILHGKSLKPLTSFYILFAIAFGYYFNTVFVADYSDSSHFSFMYDWEFKLYHVGNFEKNLDFSKVEGDSIRYLAATHGILGDEKHVDQEFFERINAFGEFSRFGPEQLKRAVSVFMHSMGQNLYYIIADVLLLLSYLVLGGEGVKGFRYKTLLLFLAFYGIVLAISILKMENRFLVPFQMVFLLFIVLKHKPYLFYRAKYIWLLAIFLLIDTPFTMYGTQQKINYAQDRYNDYRHTMDFLQSNYGDQIIVFNGVINPQSRPYEVFSERKYFSEIYFYNYYAVAVSPTFRPYLESECSCDAGTLYEFYEYLSTQQEEVILLDNAERMDLLKQYLNVISEPKYRFERIDVSSEISTSLNNIGYQGDNAVYRLIPNK
ncbi:hypothetical protein N9J52_03835, partial [Flavobacteriales bacterium]|nr:hypothetical protein [Flavobacteriales bacterium]